MKKYSALPIVLMCLIQVACASQPEQPSPYPSTDSYAAIFADMESARLRAQRENKLLMYVMGANWCHDSLGFVSKTENPAFRELIDQRYVVQLINVGELQFIREVITRYGEPVIYGTPTVLVVEPNTDTLLNGSTLPYWRNADAISLEDTLAYFDAFSPGQLPEPVPDPTPALARALAEIDSFENSQAERIYLAYAELGAMISETEPGARPSQEFLAKWTNLAEMRSQITDDLVQLRSSAQQLAGSGADPVVLNYPHYDLFID